MRIFRMLAPLLLALTTSTVFAQYFTLDNAYGQQGFSRPNTYTGWLWMHQVYSSYIQSDGTMILAGTDNSSQGIKIVKLKSDGTLDNTFNTTGHATFAANGSYPWRFISISPGVNGKILVGYFSQNPGNTRVSILCIKQDGTIDASFGSNGKAEIGPSLTGNEVLLHAIDVQSDGKIIVAGSGPDALATSKYFLARLSANGIPDAGFGANGLAKCPYFINENRHMILNSVKVQPDGKILGVGIIPPGAQGYPDSIVLVQYKTNGTLDSTYGNNGISRIAGRFYPGTIRLDAANNAYVIGAETIINPKDTLYIRKFSAAGAPVTGFGNNGVLRIPAAFNVWNDHEQFNFFGRFELLADGKMIVAGTSDSSATSSFRVCRLLSNGALDNSFASQGTITVPRNMRDICTGLAIQSDGKIILSGYYRTGEATFDTARILAMRFGPPSKPNSIGSAAAPLNAGIYPNPVKNNQFILHYNNQGTPGNAHFSLVNLAGQEVEQGTFYLQPGKNSRQVLLNHTLVPGHYYLHLATPDHQTEVIKLMIKI